nr:LOW QUALITY PROTEIN: AT-rich interactive domain-containing protein 5A [Dromaius novaehollandiae]
MEEEESRAAPASPEDEPKSEGNGAAAVPPEPAGGSAPRGSPEEEEERPKVAAEEAPGEKEEEEAFLVSLYKFMKDRHTPIERIPHLGFKQINLWKIYKAVEKLGAYELVRGRGGGGGGGRTGAPPLPTALPPQVTGRRLWKNVYDELGGSPGSTSAATCTRRHYERLVLPYVRHLKGEDDKPLPPAKPRKQYKVSKEPKGPEAAEKSRRARKDKSREQAFVPPPPRAKRGPEEEEEEAPFGLKLRAVSPFGKEAEGRDKGAGSQQGLAKPKAVVAGGGYPAPLAAAVPQIPDVYKGAMLRFPVSFPLEHLKTPGAPLAPNLPVNPFVIPAFPSPLVAAPTQPSEPGRYPYDGSLRPRLYAAATWHGRPGYASPHAFHRHTKL